MLFQTIYAVPRQIKPGFLKLTIRRGQSNFSIAFIFVSFEEKGYYRVVSVGQLSFDCRSQLPYARPHLDSFWTPSGSLLDSFWNPIWIPIWIPISFSFTSSHPLPCSRVPAFSPQFAKTSVNPLERLDFQPFWDAPPNSPN